MTNQDKDLTPQERETRRIARLKTTPANITEYKLTDIELQCFRLDAVLKSAQPLADTLWIPLDEEIPREQRSELDDNATQTKLLIESARLLLWDMMNEIGEATGTGRQEEKPEDL